MVKDDRKIKMRFRIRFGMTPPFPSPRGVFTQGLKCREDAFPSGLLLEGKMLKRVQHDRKINGGAKIFIVKCTPKANEIPNQVRNNGVKSSSEFSWAARRGFETRACL